MTWGEDTFGVDGDQANGYNGHIYTSRHEATYVSRIHVQQDIGSLLLGLFSTCNIGINMRTYFRRDFTMKTDFKREYVFE